MATNGFELGAGWVEVEAVGVAMGKVGKARDDSKSDKGSWCHMTWKNSDGHVVRSKFNAQLGACVIVAVAR